MTSNSTLATDIGLKSTLWLNIRTKTIKFVDEKLITIHSQIALSVDRMHLKCQFLTNYMRVGTVIVATIYLQLIQNRYMFRTFTFLQYSNQHCVQPVASDVEVVGYL